MSHTKIQKARELQDLIHVHWKNNHILSFDRKLFFFLYKKNNKLLNIITTNNKGKINSFLGFIPMFKYNNIDKNKDVCFLALWFKGQNANHLDVILKFKRLISLKKWEAVCVIGINKKVSEIYKRFHFKIKKMSHYYEKTSQPKVLSQNSILSVNSLRNIDFKKYSNYKNEKYFINKYLKNPFYKYFLYRINNKENTNYFISRIILLKTSNLKIFRIIDFIGDINVLLEFKSEINNIAHKLNCDYFDFLIGGDLNYNNFCK